ncbi:PstS family phosphate ABC transporter substrate-binding protein [Streptacidiphilus sp. N1-3]|uniref:PstS family phosphate ABC transporter substrate-binding protein n=1 Tax=Streptacidiphilus alkalitolerans TaxID=3342712 RepID=A0ABV6X4A0_9ACTN
MRKTALAKIVSATALTAAAVTLAAGPALADPPVGTTPAATSIVGVGSDTIQAVFNQFSTDYTGTPKLYSWDATGTSPIITKTGATSIARPNGSGAGVSALESTTRTTVDFARVSSALPATAPTNDWYIPFAKDAVSWAAQTGGNAPANLTTADLTKIFSTCTITKWNQITDIPGYTGPATTIKAYLPQTSSGTRSFFLGQVGPAGACVQTTTVEENEGSNPLLQTADSIVPYSVAHFIGQVYGGHGSGTDVPGPLTVRQINGITPIDPSTHVITTPFSTSVFGRNVSDVVRGTDWNAGDAHATALKAIFSTTGWICTNATAQADLASYGFLHLATCGIPQHH